MCRKQQGKSNAGPVRVVTMTRDKSSAKTLALNLGPVSNMRKSLRNLATALAFGLAAISPIAANAHAVVVKAWPAPDQHLPVGRLDINLEFNSRIDKERSKLELTMPGGEKIDLGIVRFGEPNVVSSSIGLLIAGPYSLRWQVLAIDGHITRGDIPFTVKP
jgi:copper resistance protein C